MTEENNTPDVSSGQDHSSATPDTSVSGQGGAIPENMSGQGATTTGESVQSQAAGLPPQYLQELDKRTQHFNQKITEMGQMTAQYKQQLEQQQKREEQFKQSLGQYYGFNDNQNQPVDPLNLLLDNPDQFWEMAANKTGLKEKVERLEQMEKQQEVSGYLGSQEASMNTLKEKYNFLNDDLKKQVLDITPYMPPRVQQIQQALNDQFVSAQDKQKLTRELDTIVAQTLSQQGGYEGLALKNLGRVVAENPGAFLQQAAQTYNQKQFAAQRAGKFGGGYTGGAPTGAPQGGGVKYASETVYKS